MPNGIFNSRNFLIWHEENPHAVCQGAFQHRWSINVQAGMIGNRVVSSYVRKEFFSGIFFTLLSAVFRLAHTFFRHVLMGKFMRISSIINYFCSSTMTSLFT